MWVHQILALPFPNSHRTSDKLLPGPQLPHLYNGPINRMALGFKETVHLKYLLLYLVYSKDLAHVGYYCYCILLFMYILLPPYRGTVNIYTVSFK